MDLPDGDDKSAHRVAPDSFERELRGEVSVLQRLHVEKFGDHSECGLRLLEALRLILSNDN